jgi:hypothetical protein
LFGTAHGVLRGLGVRVPRLVALESDAALVEDVRAWRLAGRPRGRPADPAARDDPDAARHRADYYGRPTRPRHDRRAEVLDRALDHLDQAAAAVDRLRYYRLAQYLSLVAGPSRLLAGGFPDRAGMLRIMTANVERVLGET